MPSSATVLLIGAVLSAHAVLGQSLSIIKKGPSEYWIEASAPTNNPYALRASVDLNRWLRIQDQVQGQYSSRIDTAGSQRFFRMTASTPPAPPIVVMLIGDSMAADCCGWGQGIFGYFKPSATVVNYATAWASTKVFLRSAELDKMLLVKPDYVLIQYSFMDMS